ncbi:hypothetical protein [Sandarakinorhabdus sp. DWP1-3-1]|uniref:hypothetical protein n=1 Tax=Sandarakinorhabdus sp. DWP1-3-1 TaxID=2804627 RepID=UPI003CEF12C1
MTPAALQMLPLALALIASVPLPVPDSLRDRVIADAQAMPPATLVFERTTRSVRTGGGTTTNLLKVERWDGRRWQLVSINGKKPTSGQREEAQKLAAASPVPGYHRMAVLLSGATERTTDSQGRTVLKIPVLPAGSVRTDSADISSHLQAEVVLATRAGQPWVERVKVTSREPFRMNMLIKVLTFEQTSEYRLDDRGRPRLASQVADSAGTMFGFAGGEKSEVTYAYR